MGNAMTWYQDLAPCSYFHLCGKDHLKAIGWLEAGRPFKTGQMDPQIRERLDGIIRIAPITVLYCGLHPCDFCPPDPSTEWGRLESSANYFVPGMGTIYAIPGMIRHYIDAHRYLPPDEFRDAVANCPLDPEAYVAAVVAVEPALLRYLRTWPSD
jgi:hypothetical protein